MSQGIACEDKKAHQYAWVVTMRGANKSAFGGYRLQTSRYSQVMCPRCEHTWRTNAAYVAALPDADLY